MAMLDSLSIVFIALCLTHFDITAGLPSTLEDIEVFAWSCMYISSFVDTHISHILQCQSSCALADGSAETAGGGAVAGRKAVDFENLAFAQGNHLMTNKKCELPNKSYRAAHKAS